MPIDKHKQLARVQHVLLAHRRDLLHICNSLTVRGTQGLISCAGHSQGRGFAPKCSRISLGQTDHSICSALWHQDNKCGQERGTEEGAPGSWVTGHALLEINVVSGCILIPHLDMVDLYICI